MVLPRADLPEACEALEAWAARAGLQPGEPVFRAVSNRHAIAGKRLDGRSVSRIVQKAIRDLAKARGSTKAEAAALAKAYSGHSLRAGFVTAAAGADVPALRIADHVRHKSLEMTLKYVRTADKYSKSALKGVLRPQI